MDAMPNDTHRTRETEEDLWRLFRDCETFDWDAIEAEALRKQLQPASQCRKDEAQPEVL